jgi:transcriptional regulator with XRE-family HTH domain
MMTLAEIVLVERRRQNLSQAGLAEMAGVHRNTVSQIENGSLDIRLETLGRVITALGFTMEIKLHSRKGDE